MHWVTQDGQLLVSHVVTDGTYELFENSSFHSSGALNLNAEPDRYTCSGNTLQLFAPNGSSVVLARQVPKTRQDPESASRRRSRNSRSAALSVRAMAAS